MIDRIEFHPRSCTTCPRLVASRRCVVPGFGPVPADVMVVAQGPGAQEEKNGQPLWHKAWSGGKLRYKLMPLAGINHESVRYENVTACRGPKGKTGDAPPTAKEIANCRQYLMEAIRQTKPKFIITLGAPAMKWFAPKVKLDEVHGQMIEWEAWECDACQNVVTDLPDKCDKCGLTNSGHSVASRFNPIAVKVVPMYHPAAATPNRNPRLAIVMDKDWRRLGEYLHGTDRGNSTSVWGGNNSRGHFSGNSKHNSKIGNYKLISGIKLARLMRRANLTRFAFDYETTECMWNNTFQARRAEPIGYSVAWKEGEAYYTTDSINHIKPFLEDPAIEVIAHNAKFEWIVSKNVNIDLTNMHDTKLMAYLLRKPSTSLKDLAWSELQIKQTRYEEVDWNDVDSVTQYGAADSDITLRLYNTLLRQLRKDNLENVYEQIERPLIPVLGRMEMNGVLIDPVPFAQLEVQLNERLVAIDGELETIYPYSINWRSVPQKANALYGEVDGGHWESEYTSRRLTFKEWSKTDRARDLHYQSGIQYQQQLISRKTLKENLDIKELNVQIQIPFTKLTGWIPSGLGITTAFGVATDIPTLRRIEESDAAHPIIPILIERSTITRALSGEVVNLPALCQEDGRVHTSFHQAGGWEEQGGEVKEGTETGRLSSSGPNLHNITHHGDTARPYVAEWGKSIRRGIVAPAGWSIVKADVGQEEPRIGAFKSGDSELQAAIESGDMYLVSAGMAFGKDPSEIDREERQIGKRMFMAWLNRAGPAGIKQSAFWLEKEAAQKVLNYLAARFWRFEDWCEKEVRGLHRNGYVLTHFGRKVVFPEVWTRDPYVVAKAERACIPGVIQGTAADIIKIILAKLDKPVYNIKGRLVLNVHDEIVAEVLDDKVDETVELVSHMTDNILPIHLPIEIAVGQSWGDAKLVMTT